jgi:hypothetical protein
MPVSVTPQLIVLIRFSYVSLSGFVVSKDGEDAVRAMLYDPARLERRFALFEALTLPSLLAQTDQNFTTVCLIGRDFPLNYRDRLQKNLSRLPDAQIVALKPYHIYRATRAALNQAVRPTTSHIVSMRIDDDDAVGTDCMAETLRLVPHMMQMAGPDQPSVIAFNAGLFLEFRDGGNRLYGVSEKTPLGLGMSMISPVGATQSVFSMDHRRVHQRFNTYTDAQTPRFIRTVHRDNDSCAYLGGESHAHDDETLAQILSRNFPFTLSELRALRG